MRARAKTTMTGIDFDYSDRAALETSAEERTREYERRWNHGGLWFLGAFKDLMVSDEANDTCAEYVRAKIRARVRDPEIARLLSPTNTIGCKRLCVDIGYYETFNRPNVTLIDVSERPIDAITPRGRQGARARAQGRRHRVRHRLRRHDGRAQQDRHPRTRRPAPAREVERGPARLPGRRHGGLPQPLHDHRARAARRC